MTRPKLVRRARLRFDELRGGWLLLWPERGLRLNESASSIVRLCDGTRTVDEMIDAIREVTGAPRQMIAFDVHRFLARIAARGLLERTT